MRIPGKEGVGQEAVVAATVQVEVDAAEVEASDSYGLARGEGLGESGGLSDDHGVGPPRRA